MSTFKSDKIDISLSTYENLYASIPTGCLVPIAGPVSLYSSPSVDNFINLGLLPCSGSQWSISTYQELYNIITVNGSVFPFGANTNGSGGAGSTHFVLPNMYTTKYFLSGTASNISVSNTVGHTHSHNVSTGLTANAAAWNHYHNFNSGSSEASMGAHNHNYPAGNASSAGNGGSVISKNSATGPVGSSTTHNHGSFNMNATVSTNQNAGTHIHSGNSASSSETSGGLHSHSTGTITSTPAFNSNSVAVYPSFVNMLYFIKS